MTRGNRWVEDKEVDMSRFQRRMKCSVRQQLLLTLTHSLEDK